MSQALARLIEQPTGPHFRAAWRAVRKTGRKLEFARLQAWLSAGRLNEVRTELAVLPQWLKLSPRVHELAALAAERAGDARDAEIEQFLFRVCTQGILASGDGSLDRPYLAVQLEDEAVLLAILGREAFSQALVAVGSRMLDAVLCRDGSEVFFDVTHLVVAAPRKVRRLVGAPGSRKKLPRLQQKVG